MDQRPHERAHAVAGLDELVVQRAQERRVVRGRRATEERRRHALHRARGELGATRDVRGGAGGGRVGVRGGAVGAAESRPFVVGERDVVERVARAAHLPVLVLLAGRAVRRKRRRRKKDKAPRLDAREVRRERLERRVASGATGANHQVGLGGRRELRLVVGDERLAEEGVVERRSPRARRGILLEEHREREHPCGVRPAVGHELPLPHVLGSEIGGDVLRLEKGVALFRHPERDLRSAAVPALDRPVELRERAVHERLVPGQDLAKVAIARKEVVQEMDRFA